MVNSVLLTAKVVITSEICRECLFQHIGILCSFELLKGTDNTNTKYDDSPKKIKGFVLQLLAMIYQGTVH